MLQINRNYLSIPTNEIYFDNKRIQSRYKAKISWYTHRLKPSRRLQSKRTIQIDLQENETIFINNLPENTKEILFENNDEKFKIIPFMNPIDEQLNEFQRFYNENLQYGEKINRSKFQSLLLLRNSQAMILTRIENSSHKILGYRLYVVDGQNALLLYVSIANELVSSRRANLLLCWEDINMFRRIGYEIYDFGNVDTELPLRCNEYFGGKEVTVFSGYIAKSFTSKLIAKMNQWGEKKK